MEKVEEIVKSDPVAAKEFKDLFYSKLYKWAEATDSGLEKSAGFVQEQAPLVAQEIIAYNRAIYTSLESVLLITMVTVVIIWRKIFRSLEDNNDKLGVSVIAMLFFFLLCIGFLGNGDNLLKSWLAPRLMFVEYVVELAK